MMVTCESRRIFEGFWSRWITLPECRNWVAWLWWMLLMSQRDGSYWIKLANSSPWIADTWCTVCGSPSGCSPSWSHGAGPSPWTQTPGRGLCHSPPDGHSGVGWCLGGSQTLSERQFPCRRKFFQGKFKSHLNVRWASVLLRKASKIFFTATIVEDLRSVAFQTTP